MVGVVVQEVSGWRGAQGQPAPPGVTHTGDTLVKELSTKFQFSHVGTLVRKVDYRWELWLIKILECG